MGTYNQGGGGPWGGGPWGGGGGSPWGGGPRGSGPRGRGPQPPNIEDLIRRGQDQIRRLLPGGFGSGRGIGLVLAGLAVIWLFTGLYRVEPDEVGVVLRFGEYNRTTQPGLNWHLPSPIERVLTPKVTRVNRVEVGFRAGEGVPRGGGLRQVPEEALMLTGDENIVDINFTVFWVIKDAQQYLFNIRAPEATVKAAAESAMREVIGRTPIALALAEGKAEIEAGARRLLQEVLDRYESGIEITQVQLQKVDPPAQVIDAYRDVQRARADQERERNQAEAYRNDIVPRARGEAVRLEQEAEAYKQEIVARAQGDTQRFLSIYEAYKAAPEITRQRLFLETMEEVLKGTQKVIIDPAAEGIVPYLPLPEIRRQSAPATGTSASPSAPRIQSPSVPQVQQPSGGRQ